MPSYTAPVEDMMFLFEKLRDNKKYNELEKYKEVSSDLVKDILEEAAKINQNLILPLAKAGDENPAVLENGVVRTPPGYKEAYKKYIEDGWTSLSCDSKYGGQGMPKTVSAFFDEMLSSASLSFKLYSELSIGAYNCINHHASDELKNRYEFLKQDNTKLVLLMIGGENKRYSPHGIDYFDLSMKVIKSLKNFNAKLLVSFSRRTPKKAISIIDKSFSKYLKSYEILPMSENNPYPDILKNIDYAIVTSDSVNMISEIATTPIPVFIYKFPKESGKILDFLDDLESLGIIKILDNKLFIYTKTKLNTNKDTALKVNKFLGI